MKKPKRPAPPASKPELFFEDRSSFHTWLEENHTTSNGFFLLRYKAKHPDFKKCIPYTDAIDEALCFGWIDSIQKRRDDLTYIICFTPRRKGGVWSEVNKARIEKLEADGRLQPAGHIAIKKAKEDGSWYFLDEIDQMIVPEDLKKLLTEMGKMEAFDELSASKKKLSLLGLKQAKTTPTRLRRINEILKGLG
ncbi:hypothetical protein BC829DRAFT_407846 [Chytridium lagenaria]|nr:hypothetical protein BC829DRAFT_407846 [Chytridium lagenaria]